MGIGSIVRKTARKAADFAENGISAASELSPDQLKDIEAKRNAYLTAMPDPSPGNEIAQELTSRLLAAASVELQNSYLPQISELYLPVDRNLEMGDGGFDTSHNVRSIHIDKWVDNPDENGLEKLVNVYGTLADENCNVALIFHRTADSVDVSIAVADLNNAGSSVEADNLCARLESSLRGNFPGSSWGPVGTVPKCLDNAAVYSVASATNIPTEKSEKFVSQTIEKLLDGIVPDSKRTEYTLILLATPIWDVEERKARLAELYSALTPYSTWQTNYQVSENTSLGSTATVSVNVGASAGIQVGINDSIAKASSKSDSSSQAASRQTSQTNSDTASEANTDTDSINAGVDAGGSIVRAHVDTSHSTSTTKSLSKTLSETVGKSVTDTLGKAVTKGFTSTTGQSKSNSFGVNAGMSFARSSSSTATIGRNEGITQNFGNYAIKHALEILEQQTKRYEQSTALGLWDFAAYVLSEDVNTARNVAHTYLALTQGPDSNLSTAAVNVWRGDGGPQMGAAASICGYLRELRHPLFGLDPAILESEDEETKAYCVYPATVTATTALSGKELAYSLNFPKKSVPGLPVIECAAFGRNVSTFDGTQPTTGLTLGKVFHMHREEPVKVLLQKDSLASHVFVTGSTGAGKTNTVCRILDQALEKDVKFLVVEPAKGEYKSVYGGVEGVRVFGTNPAAAPLLRINPFSFPEGVHVLEHLDRLVEIFNVCWPMYAAMPAVLKDAVSRSYADCGWDLATSENPFGPGLWPTFADVARNVREILDESEYDAENKGAYKGSLLTRLQSLTNGLNGMMLVADEVPAEQLFDENCVVDLSRVGSAETKSLLMGLLVVKLQEHRMATSPGMNLPLRHLTVLEEAHNLLKRTSGEQAGEGGNLAGKSVEMISNAIAEMRTYGEGFVIADQAPGLLDMAAIRNTNTKIIMRLPDLSDRELAGRAANLNDRQITELARLPKGVAAVYQNDWVEPVLCKVTKAEDGAPWAYERPTADASTPDAAGALAVAEILVRGEKVSDQNRLRDIREKLDRLGLDASMKVRVLRCVQDPPTEPRMTKLAPMMSALFPEVAQAAKDSLERSKQAEQWTRAAEAALRTRIDAQMDDTVRRAVIQGVMTDLLHLQMRDEKAFSDWYRNGGLA